MKRFLLFVNAQKERAPETAGFVKSYLLSRGAEKAEITESLAGLAPGDQAERAALLKEYDCVITFGGDGTIIRAARCTAGSSIPIAGINLGHLGYLTLVSDQSQIHVLLDALLQDRCSTEKRMMLEGSVYTSGDALVSEPQLSLNEIVISRKSTAGAVDFCVMVNGAFLNEYKADGIIISTPTGSTAYNLSAGGPIVDPTARMTILTPICPHALNRSSIVLKAEDMIDLLIPETASDSVSLSFDGAVQRDIQPGSRIHIGESELYTSLICLKGGSFLSRIRSKLTAL